MDKKESDDYEFEFQKLVEHRKAEIDASGMSRDELIDLIARNLVSYDSLCRSYEENCRQFEEANKMRAETCDLLEEQNKMRAETCDLLKKQNAEMERKFLAAVNAIPKAIQAGMKAGATVLASNAGKKGGFKKNTLTNELKEWALREAATMRGADMEMSRTLANRIPEHLSKASTTPQTLIYKALLKRRNQDKTKPVRGFSPIAASRQR